MGFKRLRRLPAVLITLAAVCVLSPGILARELTFQERVRAQEAIERVYYSHQVGATRPFEEAVPRALLERKVRAYLKQSAALEHFWKTPITAEMLRAEMARMNRQSRMPERLRELYLALDNDSFLIAECLARPALASRLVGNFFAFDERIHSATRHQAEAARAKAAPDKPLIVVEERDAFVFRERAPGSAGTAGTDSHNMPPVAKRIPKIRLDAWWQEVEAGLDAGAVHSVGNDGSGDILPGSQTASAQSCLTDNTWDSGSLDDFPYGHFSPTAVWTGTTMVVWGGFAGGVLVNTGGRYDPATDTWLSTSLQNAPPPSSRHTAVWTGSEMIIWGSDNPTPGASGAGWRYNPLTDAWTPTSLAGAPTARGGHVAVWTGTEMIVWGGGSITGGRYNPSTDSWVPTAFDPSIFPQDGQGAVWTGTEMIVWGGYTPTGGRYNPSTNTWGDVSFVNAPEGGPGAAHPLVVWTGTLMLVLTPFSTTAGGRYDPVSNVWTTMSSSGAPELDRGGATAVWTGSEMILWGGQGGIDVDLNTGGRYNPSTDSWTILSTLNAPRGRFGHVAVWTGSRMVVWGGGVQFIGLDLNSGGRYDPASDSWTPTSQSSAPAARRFHQTVWTGNSMIVWGGDDGFIYPDTGGRYDPALDSWTPTSTTGPPAGRTGFTAVWTGNAMIVWGGGSFRNDGAQYDPVADLWSPTSLAGAPSGRALHTAVWTGTKMIIWGGNSGTALNTGAIYDPLANSWSPTSLSGAPSIRNSHVAVWTEDHMVVWGGFNGSTALNTGGRYDSATDQWTPTSTLNAPSGGSTQKAVWTGSLMLVWGDGKSRYDPLLDQWTAYSPAPSQVQSRGHSAIWTGSRMIIWGGGGVPGPSGVPLYDTGGIYDPAGDTWTLTSTQNAASSRRYHTAVWTGAFMIVWGGTGPGEYSPHLNTGGRFIFGLSTDDDGDTFTECSGDCNDSSAAIHPGATEVCNGIDDNCSLVTDEDGSALCDDTNACTADTCTGATGCAHPIRDVDTDGHPDGACGGSDCNDLNPAEWSPPVEVSGLTLTTPSPADPSWASQAEAAGPGTSYDLVSGTLGPSAGVSFPTASCLQSAMATAYSDSRPGPSSGIAYWYLARARNSCATATYGSPNRDSGIPSCP